MSPITSDTAFGAVDVFPTTGQTGHSAAHNQIADYLDLLVAEYRHGNRVNIKNYGALGDNATSDVGAWNAALAALPSNGILELPPGIYYMSSPIACNQSNVIIKGSGMGTTILKQGAGISSNFVSLNASGITIEDLTIDGNQAANTGAVGSALAFGADDITAHRVEVKNFNSLGITCDTVRPRILFCRVIGIGSPTAGSYMGIWYDSPSGAVGVLILGCTVRDMQANGIFVGGTGSRIIGCYLTGNHHRTTTGGGQIAHASASNAKRSLIQGCTIENGGGNVCSGIECDVTNVSIIGNVIRGHDNNGVICQSGSGYRIIGNEISNSGRSDGTNNQPGIQVNSGLSKLYIAGNLGYDDRSPKRQTYTVKIDSGATEYTVLGNHGGDNLTGCLLDSGGAVTKYVPAGSNY